MASELRVPSAKAVRHIQTARKDVRNLRGLYGVLAAFTLVLVSIPALVLLLEEPSVGAVIGLLYPFVCLAASVELARRPLGSAVGVAAFFTVSHAFLVVTGAALPDFVPIMVLLLLWGCVPTGRRVAKVKEEYGSLSVARAAAKEQPTEH